MEINSSEIRASIDKVRGFLQEDETIPPTMRATLETLLLVLALLIDRLGLNSRNSSKPPSFDPNRKKTPSGNGGQNKKPGGQNDHTGSNLKPVPVPDIIIPLPVDSKALPPGQYREEGFEARQVFNLDISVIVTEYQAQILVDQNGKRWIAPFPPDVTAPVQYGPGVKANAVYASQYQLIPYNRVEEQFKDQFQLPLSAGTVFNFNQDAYNRLEPFEQWVKDKLLQSPLLQVDETGVNINGKQHWLHNASNKLLTLFQIHAKRGGEAMDAIGVLPAFKGILCHDHWKPYFNYGGNHALCNAHHLRELEWAAEQDKQQWAKELQSLLKEMCHTKNLPDGFSDQKTEQRYRDSYRAILDKADQECPPPDEQDRNGKRGRLKRSKSRNLLERLRDDERSVLLFMENPIVPFSNNQAENDIRMTKVHQKVSGCFRSLDGAAMFCRIRSFLSTCQKNGVSATSALNDLFQGKWPDFMNMQ